MNRPLLVVTTLAFVVGVSSAQPAATAQAPLKVREPAVAGLFYPRDAAALSKAVESLVASAKTERKGQLKALICPHAGYAYSGPVAGSGFHLLQGLRYQTVVLLGPAHYAALSAASVSGDDVFRTPLGDVPISPKARLLGKTPPFAIDPPCYVERPDWAEQSSRGIPARKDEHADTWEHSDEVEVPFLQKTLPAFELVPVVMGDVDPAAAARALDPLLDDNTLVVVSSDLSHYHPYTEARQLDQRCVDAICSLDVRTMRNQEACGRIPILTLLHLARQRGWTPQRIDLRNSGDTSGDKSRVVGYAAIAFYAPAPDTPLTAEERQFLLTLARTSVRDVVTTGKLVVPAGEGLSSALNQPKGVFVTLTEHGQLRGCIGHIVPQMPLYRAVAENARNAALEDPRFSPVTSRELSSLDIEISVLSEPRPLAFDSPQDLLRKLRPNIDGVVLRIAAGAATYLPQVWEQLPDKTDFLDTLSEKAGGREGDWRKPGTTVSTYQVEAFKEPSR